MEVNLNSILESLGLKDKFDQKAQEAYTKAKEEADDPSVFESKDKFIEHYSDEIFGNSSAAEMPLDDFVKHVQDAGFIEENEIPGFAALVNRDGNETLSRQEASDLLGTAYDSATGSDKELYESIKVQKWGTGVDDCLSRIIQKHVDGVKLYSDDYNQYVEEVCKLNDIDDPNMFNNPEVKLPEIKRDKNNEFIRDDYGKLQFYTEDELKKIKGVEDSNEPAVTEYGQTLTTKNSDGSISRQTLDENGRILTEELTQPNGEITNLLYSYNDDGTTEKTINNPDGSIINLKLDKNMAAYEETRTDTDGTVTEFKFDPETGEEYERLQKNPDGTAIHGKISNDGVIMIHKTDVEGKTSELSYFDKLGKIAYAETTGNDISRRTYTDGTVIEWGDDGTTISNAYDNLGQSIGGYNFVNQLDLDSTTKELLNEWIYEQEEMPSNTQIYDKILELKEQDAGLQTL